MTNVKTIGLWSLKAVVALLFVAAAGAKILGVPMMVHEFDTIGLGQGFRYFTGTIELVGAVLLLIPRTSRLGSPLLLTVVIGALFAQALRLHGDVVHVFVLMAATGFLAWVGWRDRISRAA